MTASSYYNYRRKLYACAVENKSDFDIKVIITYVAIPYENNEMRNSRKEFDLAPEKIKWLSEKLVTRPTHNIREVIEKVHATLSNGKKFELTAPFDDVRDPTADWRFIVDNNGIKSAGPNPEVK